MPDNGGNRTDDLWNASQMLRQATQSVRFNVHHLAQFVEDWASFLKFVGSIPTVVRHIFHLMSRTNVASVGSVFNDTRKVKVLSLPETIKEKSTFRAKVLRRELTVTPTNYY